MFQSFFIQGLILTFHAVRIVANPCECHTINSWKDLKSLIMTKTHQHSGSEQLNLPLCPFNIGKYHKDDTNHWSEIIYIPSPVHIYCKKENPSDLCAITVTGRQCGKNKNCGRQLFKIMSGK